MPPHPPVSSPSNLSSASAKIKSNLHVVFAPIGHDMHPSILGTPSEVLKVPCGQGRQTTSLSSTSPSPQPRKYVPTSHTASVNKAWPSRGRRYCEKREEKGDHRIKEENKMREPTRLRETRWFEVDLACKGCVSNDRVQSVVAEDRATGDGVQPTAASPCSVVPNRHRSNKVFGRKG